jgi:Tfp pilus assembly protein PilN
MVSSVPLDLNILPEQYRPRRVPAATVMVMAMIIAMLLGLPFAYRTLLTTQARTTELQAQLDQTKTALTQSQAEQVRVEEHLAEVEQQIEQTRAQITHLRQELGALSHSCTSQSAGIATAVAALVPRVHITGIVQSPDAFVLSGEAGSQALVLDYARALQAGGYFANVRVLSITDTDPSGLAPEIEFDIVLEQ